MACVAMSLSAQTVSKPRSASSPGASSRGASSRSAAAPAVRFDRAALAIPSTTFVLDNGLTLIVHEDHSSPIVSVNTWYHVGSRNERRGRTGFAHLFEHFFFNGSEHYPHGFREAMDDLGASNRNGTTNKDRTNFYEDVPVGALERTLYLEADRMGFLAATLSEAMLERERGVVKNEMRQGENRPYGRVGREMDALMYPHAHPYSWSTIGSIEDLDAARIDDIREWYRSYYGPNNAVLTLAGDITPERALELVRRYFGDIPPGPPLSRLDQWVPRFDRNIRQRMADRVPQARIVRAYHVPGWGDDDLGRLTLFASVLSGSKSAPLDRRLVHEMGLATAVSASVSDGEIAGLFRISATVREGVDPDIVEREIDAVVAALIDAGPTPVELARAQSRIIAGVVRGNERLASRSNILNESMTFGGSPDAWLDDLEVIARSTPADVRTAARRWIGEAHHATMLVVPHGERRAAERLVDRSQLPTIGEPAEGRFPPVQRARLGNGLEVMLLERHSTPMVRMALAVGAGSASDPASRTGIASLALELLDEGTATRSSFAITDELASLGAEITSASGLDVSTVRLGTLSASLPRALELYAEIIRAPSFPEAELELQKRRTIAAIEQQRADPTSAAMRLLPGLVYGPSHPYGQPAGGIGYESTVGALTREHLREWHRERFRPNNATLVVTGDVTMAALVPMLERVFGDWQSGDAPALPIGPAAGTARGRIFLIDRPGAPQSVIVAAHATDPIGADDDIALEIAMRTFGGIATSRLNRNLRLEKHWSYGAFGGVRATRGPRMFSVVAPVQTDRTKEAMAEVAREIAAIAGERPIVGEELASTMRNVTLRLPARFETLADLERAGLELVLFGLPDDYWSGYPEKVRAIGAPALDAAARRHVRPSELVWVVVGDRATIEQGVRELGLGVVEIVGEVP